MTHAIDIVQIVIIPKDTQILGGGWYIHVCYSKLPSTEGKKNVLNMFMYLKYVLNSCQYYNVFILMCYK